MSEGRESAQSLGLFLSDGFGGCAAGSREVAKFGLFKKL